MVCIDMHWCADGWPVCVFLCSLGVNVGAVSGHLENLAFPLFRCEKMLKRRAFPRFLHILCGLRNEKTCTNMAFRAGFGSQWLRFEDCFSLSLFFTFRHHTARVPIPPLPSGVGNIACQIPISVCAELDKRDSLRSRSRRKKTSELPYRWKKQKTDGLIKDRSYYNYSSFASSQSGGQQRPERPASR